jgi:hypothetical protein
MRPVLLSCAKQNDRRPLQNTKKCCACDSEIGVGVMPENKGSRMEMKVESLGYIA